MWPCRTKLAALRAAGGDAHAVDDVIQAALERAQHVFAGNALLLRGLFEQVAELAFEDAEIAASLLLFAKLDAIADDLGLLVLAVLAGRKVALFDGALLAVAALALSKTTSCPRGGKAGTRGHCIVPNANLQNPAAFESIGLSGAVYGQA